MGACLQPNNTPERQASNRLDRVLRRHAKRTKNIHKLLFLGPGDSGKSTIFKQLVSLFGDGYSKEERKQFTRNIHSNVVLSIKALVAQSEIWGNSVKVVRGVEYNCDTAPELKASKDFVDRTPDEALVDHELVGHIRNLWEDRGIQAVVQLRSEFQFPFQVEYFFSRLDAIPNGNYVPSLDDIIYMRQSTTGILEAIIEIFKTKIQVVDVGGQRSERRKWINCFENVTSLVYVCSLSAYDQQLFEDETTNAFKEAIELFEEISSSHYFRTIPIIVFLNKSDLFAEKIETVPFSKCSVLGAWHERQPPYDFKESTNFIRRMFLDMNKLNSRNVYTHVTTATDQDNIKRVFIDLKDIIARTAFKQGGLMMA